MEPRLKRDLSDVLRVPLGSHTALLIELKRLRHQGETGPTGIAVHSSESALAISNAGRIEKGSHCNPNIAV